MQDPQLFLAILGVMALWAGKRWVRYPFLAAWVWLKAPNPAWFKLMAQLDPAFTKKPADQQNHTLKRLYFWQLNRRFIGCAGLRITEEMKWVAALAAFAPHNQVNIPKRSSRQIYIFPAELILRNDFLTRLSKAVRHPWLAQGCVLLEWHLHQNCLGKMAANI